MLRTGFAYRLTVLVTAGLLAACGADESVGDHPTGPATRPVAADSPEVLAENLDAPWSLAFAGDTALISERDSARILELEAPGRTREVGVVADAAPRGEGGLLGLAVRERWLFAYFTADDDNRIVRYELRGEPGDYTLGTRTTLLDGLPAAGVHNGGRLAFGPDGMLYATVGDAGDRDSARDRDSYGGTVLRMTPDGAAPADNPFPGSLVYSYGHRNPQGLAWSADGTMYASEFGQNTWDELNVIEAGGDYGWPLAEGRADRPGLIDPIAQWVPSEASPSGMTILGDRLYTANLRGHRLRVIPLDDPAADEERFTREHGRLRDAVRAPDGSLLLLTNNTDGRGRPSAGDDRILRVTP